MFEQFGDKALGTGPMMLFNAGLGILGAGMQMQASDKQLNLTEDELNTQSNQIETAESERSFHRVNNLKDILNSNLAVAAARGTSPGSGSFKAIQQRSESEFDEDERMDRINTQFKEQSIEEEKKKAEAEADAKDSNIFTKIITSIL